jgi:hypothetical protein
MRDIGAAASGRRGTFMKKVFSNGWNAAYAKVT